MGHYKIFSDELLKLQSRASPSFPVSRGRERFALQDDDFSLRSTPFGKAGYTLALPAILTTYILTSAYM